MTDVQLSLETNNPLSGSMCGVCYENDVPMQETTCGHTFCVDCVTTFIKIKIESRDISSITCMDPYCSIPFTSDEVKTAVDAPLFAKFEQFLLEERIVHDATIYWCVNPACSAVVKVEAGSSTAKCSECKTKICTSCSGRSHPWRTCEQSQKRHFGKWERSRDVTPCPSCKIRIEKNGGCQHMTCRNCKHQFCWKCLGKWRGHSSKRCKFTSFPLWGRSTTRRAASGLVLGPPAVSLGLGVGAAAVGVGTAAIAVGVAGATVASPAIATYAIMKRQKRKKRSEAMRAIGRNSDGSSILHHYRSDQQVLEGGLHVFIHDDNAFESGSGAIWLRSLVSGNDGHWEEEGVHYIATCFVSGKSTTVNFVLWERLFPGSAPPPPRSVFHVTIDRPSAQCPDLSEQHVLPFQDGNSQRRNSRLLFLGLEMYMSQRFRSANTSALR